MLTELRQAGELHAGRPNNADNASAFLSGFGISQQQSSRWQRLSTVPEDAFSSGLTCTGSPRSQKERASLRHGHSGRVAEREDLPGRGTRYRSLRPVLVSMSPPPLLRRCRVREWAIAQA